MDIIRTAKEMRWWGSEWKRDPQKKVALVPTMGALHEGHAALIKKARSLASVVVVSNFVNPTQFNDPSDLQKYPRTMEADNRMCEDLGVDYVFAPEPGEMYPPGFLTSVNVSFLGSKLEGASRPGHFRGVCTICAKLFCMTQADFAVFGQKDAQQLVIIKHMVRDLGMAVEIVEVPTVRDEKGLALSSRNAHLSDEEKEKALCLSRALKRVHFLVKQQGIVHCGELLQAMRSAVTSAGEGVELDYAQIVSRNTLEELDNVERGNTLVLVAAKVGGVRLIDNTRL